MNSVGWLVVGVALAFSLLRLAEWLAARRLKPVAITTLPRRASVPVRLPGR